MPELDRRDFLKVVGLSAGAAATVGCQDPVEKIVPYLNQPEDVTPGIATYYNSLCRECPSACGISVKTREGRPIKVDGRPGDPLSDGSLCVRGQAGLARTYDGARFRGPQRRNGDRLEPTTWEDALDLLTERLAAAGDKAFFLGGSETGSLDSLIDEFMQRIGSPHRLRYEAFAHEALRAANRELFGIDSVPQFDLAGADVVVAFGTDFLETWLSPVKSQREYVGGRRDGHGHTVFVGPRLGLSAASADAWLAPEPGSEILVALTLAHEVARAKGVNVPELAAFGPDRVAESTGIDSQVLRDLAARIASAKAPLALPPGVELQGTNAAAFAAAVQLLNYLTGSIGRTVRFGPDHNVAGLGRFADLKNLAGRMRGEQIEVLLVHGVNPVYDAPQVDFAGAMSNVFTVSFSSASDETTALADLVLPDHTPFEAWGDAEPLLGLEQLQQPTVRPLFETRALGDVLLELARRLGQGDGLPGDFYALLQSRWGGGAALDRALGQGGRASEVATRSVSLQPGALSALALEPAELSGAESADLALLVYPSLHFYDGRGARLAVLNEIPDPVLKTMWGSFAELGVETAERLGVRLGDVVRVQTEAGSVELPAFPHQGVREGVVAVQAGQGHRPVDPDAPDPDRQARRQTIGVNAYPLIPGRLDAASGALAWYSARAEVSATGARALVARAQIGFDQENRGFARAMTLAAYQREEDPHAKADSGHGGGHGDGHGAEGDDVYGDKPLPAQGAASHLITKDYDPADDAHPDSPYRWGLNADLDTCVGCNACIVACAVENNSPIVGPEGARAGREMHWLRVERYVETAGVKVDVRHAPMMCQHCGAAPCESVCPVLATYHNVEGLNVMVSNRCIGTRFCSNNCPYKVRRFNHWAYDWAIEEPESFALNPDVMVRSKGVMEKCTMCVQRIAEGKDEAAREGRLVRDGDITPACAQTCPSQALTFGNLRDADSQVTHQRHDKRSYRILEHLYTRPGVNYQKAILRTDPHEA